MSGNRRRLYAVIKHKGGMNWREASDLAVEFALAVFGEKGRWTTATGDTSGKVPRSRFEKWRSEIWVVEDAR